jgi:hypothetical protein
MYDPGKVLAANAGRIEPLVESADAACPRNQSRDGQLMGRGSLLNSYVNAVPLPTIEGFNLPVLEPKILWDPTGGSTTGGPCDLGGHRLATDHNFDLYDESRSAYLGVPHR